MNNLKKDFNDSILLSSNLFTKSKIDEITNIYKENKDYKNIISKILFNSDDFKKVKNTIFKEYDIKNNKDIIKEYLLEYKNNHEKIMQENLKLLYSSYQIYKKNLLNLKIKSNVLESKSELLFKNIDFNYIFLNNKEVKDNKNEIKYSIGKELFTNIFYNEDNQNGGFFNNRNNLNNSYKKNNYKINFKNVNKLENIDDYKFGKIENIEDIIKFYQKIIYNDFNKDVNFDITHIFFPYYINIIDGLVGNHDFYILKNEYNFYEFNKDAIKFLEK